MVETFIGGGGGGGCNFLLLLFFFFFFGGGGWGMQILISIETYITCDFSGGGGGPDHLFLSGFAHGQEISNCPLPCHGLSFLKVSEGLPAGAVGNMSDYWFFF